MEIGKLFPVGGPVPPELVIGRSGEIEEIGARLREGLSTMLAGPRRIGKTTVCGAVCDSLAKDERTVIAIEVPERGDSQALLQSIVDRCNRHQSLQERGRRLLRTAAPSVERILGEQGLPLDLSALGVPPAELPARAILELPLRLAREQDRHGVLFLDELQRVVAYEGGEHLLQDLVDIYGGRGGEVAVLVDGSEKRALEGMLGSPVHFGKLVDRLTLADRIPIREWRGPLVERFAAADLTLTDESLERLLEWGRGEPYRTMVAARYAAFTARKLGSSTVERFDVAMGLDEAERHLGDDGA